MSILPSIVEKAAEYGLSTYPRKTNRGEVRVDCPFCGDRKHHCYLNDEEKIFHCFRCGESGGIAKMVAYLEDSNEEEVLERWRKEAGKNPPAHPAQRLTAKQWRFMGFYGKIDGAALRRDPEYTQRVLDWVWTEWKAYEKFLLHCALEHYVLGLYSFSMAKAEESVREMEKRSGVRHLWERAKRIHEMPREKWSDWEYIAVDFAIQFLTIREKSIMQETVITWSHSRLFRYESCPHSYYFHYVLGLEEPETEPLRFGKEVHNIIEAWLKSKQEPPFVSLEALEMAEKAMQWIQHPKKPDGVEQYFRVPLSDVDYYRGYIDVFLTKNKEAGILDWKTGWEQYTAQEKPYQLGLYLYAVQQMGWRPKKAGYVFLRFGKKGKITTGGPELIEPALEWAKSLISRTREAHKRLEVNGERPEVAFPPHSGWKCKSCGFVEICPLLRQMEAS